MKVSIICLHYFEETSYADSPSLSLIKGSAPFFMRARRISLFSLRAAMWRGVYPSES